LNHSSSVSGGFATFRKITKGFFLLGISGQAEGSYGWMLGIYETLGVEYEPLKASEPHLLTP